MLTSWVHLYVRCSMTQCNRAGLQTRWDMPRFSFHDLSLQHCSVLPLHPSLYFFIICSCRLLGSEFS